MDCGFGDRSASYRMSALADYVNFSFGKLYGSGLDKYLNESFYYLSILIYRLPKEHQQTISSLAPTS